MSRKVLQKASSERLGKSGLKTYRKRFYRKRIDLYRLIAKIKLWPSRKGILHGIRSIDPIGDRARITTHCGKTFMVRNSRNSRAARCIRNQRFQGTCPVCQVPEWKLKKFAATRFHRHHGSSLTSGAEQAFSCRWVVHGSSDAGIHRQGTRLKKQGQGRCG